MPSSVIKVEPHRGSKKRLAPDPGYLTKTTYVAILLPVVTVINGAVCSMSFLEAASTQDQVELSIDAARAILSMLTAVLSIALNYMLMRQFVRYVSGMLTQRAHELDINGFVVLAALSFANTTVSTVGAATSNAGVGMLINSLGMLNIMCLPIILYVIHIATALNKFAIQRGGGRGTAVSAQVLSELASLNGEAGQALSPAKTPLVTGRTPSTMGRAVSSPVQPPNLSLRDSAVDARPASWIIASQASPEHPPRV